MLDISKHRINMINILMKIYKHPQLSRLLAFKGGTAAYFLYELPRFSTDLDFDLVDIGQQELVFEELSQQLQGLGVIKEKKIRSHSLFLLFSYGTTDHNIKVEINTRVFNNHYELKNILGLPVLVMVQADMFAHKCIAVTDRKTLANRDLFDLHFFMSNGWRINENIIKERTGLTKSEYLKVLIEFINKKVVKQNLLQGLGEVVSEKQKYWIKQQMLDELLILLNTYLD